MNCYKEKALLIIWSYQYKVGHVRKKYTSLLRPVCLFISFLSCSFPILSLSLFFFYEQTCVANHIIFCLFLLPNNTNGQILYIWIAHQKIFLAIAAVFFVTFKKLKWLWKRLGKFHLKCWIISSYMYKLKVFNLYVEDETYFSFSTLN